MTIERRSLPSDSARVSAESRESDAAQITGYAAVFYDGTPGTEFELWPGGPIERIFPGAFKQGTRRSADVVSLVNHDRNLVLGRTPKTLRLEEDEIGLRYEVDVPDTQAGRDTLISVERGDMTGSSFGFDATKEKFVSEDGRTIREVRGTKLYDVSVVTVPAYKGTVAGVRSDGLVEVRSRYDAWQSEEETAKAQPVIAQAAARTRACEVEVANG